MSFLNYFTFALSPDFAHQERYKPLLDCAILDHVVLELAVLHVLNQGQVELRHVVLIHVEEDVSDHDDALFDLLPNAVEFSQKLLVVILLYVLSNRLQQLNRGVLHAGIEHLTVLVEDKRVGGAV